MYEHIHAYLHALVLGRDVSERRSLNGLAWLLVPLKITSKD